MSGCEKIANNRLTHSHTADGDSGRILSGEHTIVETGSLTNIMATNQLRFGDLLNAFPED